MNDNLTKLLEQLAAKLNTTVEHLWAVMVYQAHVVGISYLIGGVICLVISWFCFKYLKKLIKKTKEEEDYFDLEIITILMGMAFIGTFIGGVVSLFSGSMALANPEYWALENILDKL